MRVLVTGGCGFIGANLVPRLAAAGWQVRVLDNEILIDAISCVIILWR